jgi:cob(I)alamin adenosyltransferase
MNTVPRVLLFTGDGKGKTTAALGMAVRAAGHNLATLIVQFIKCDDTTGELAALRRLVEVEVRQVGLGFVPPSSSPRFAEHQRAACRGLEMASEALASGKYRVVVLDEICTAVAKDLVAEEAVVAAIGRTPLTTVVVLTGRGAGPGLIDLADTVTEMRLVKHGYQAGREAQEGVEF